MQWLNGNAGAVQAISTVVLVAITAYYAWTTYRVAAETRRMAGAADKASAQTQRQFLDATLPVVALRLEDDPARPAQTGTVAQFTIEVYNAGAGPAVDLAMHIDHPQLRFEMRGPRGARWKDRDPPLIVLGPGESTAILFRLEPHERPEPNELVPGSLRAAYKDIYGRRVATTLEFDLVPVTSDDPRYKKFPGELPFPVVAPGSTVISWPE